MDFFLDEIFFKNLRRDKPLFAGAGNVKELDRLKMALSVVLPSDLLFLSYSIHVTGAP